MKNIRHDSPGLRYGTSQRKGQLSGVGEAVTQGWKGVNPAAAWQAGGGGQCAGAGGSRAPSCIPGEIFGVSVGRGGLDPGSILSSSDLTRVGHPWVSDKVPHL